MKSEIFYLKYTKPHKDKIAEKETELRKFSGLFELIKTPEFENGIVQELIARQRNAEIEERTYSDRGVFSIWFYLRRLWQAQGKIKFIDEFLGYLNSIPEQLKQVSEEYNNLTK